MKCKTLFACLAAAVAAAANGETISLDGEWKLEYWDQPLSAAVRSLPLPDGLAVKTVKASVPGNCELDLVNAGILPPQEIGLNVLKLRPYEGCQWLYTKTFDAPSVPDDGSRASLVFDGIDTLADVFLNGEKIGEADNMFIQHRFVVTGRLKKGRNTVQVLIRSPFYASQDETVGEMTYHMGFADNVPFRKAAHAGGWDIFPRTYVAGLWRGVALEVEGPVRIGNVAWMTGNYSFTKDKTDGNCSVKAQFRVQGPIAAFTDGSQIRLSVSSDGKTVASIDYPLHSIHNSITMRASGFDLWWPKGAGKQPLYDASIEIVAPDGTVRAKDVQRIGFRTVELVRDDIYGPERPGQFLFKINGEPIYVRGSNWVPLDAMHGRDMQHLIPTLELFDDLNCNMVRVWGGGVYEPKEFFDFCDEHGIMVWQDFMTGCALFPQDDAYAKATDAEVRAVALAFRNHASLAIWSGNNENDSSFRWGAFKEFVQDPNRDRNSRRTIPEALFELDITRPYLPSSPYWSPDVAAGKAQPSEMHLWGERGYYKVPFYTNSPCWFASEMGYHGCPNRATIERMMTSGNVYPWKNPDVKDCTKLDWNDEWRLKASNPFLSKRMLWTRNDLMTKQAKLMFGDAARDLDGFIAQSQTVQAEAMKTFVELFRSRKFTRFNGLIWWNVRDGWPQISDAVVDYYGGKKKAYYAIRRVQRNQLVMVRDDGAVFAVNDRLHAVKGHVRIADKATGKVAFDSDYDVPANAAKQIGNVKWNGEGVLSIAWDTDGEKGRNHYLYGNVPYDWNKISTLLEGEYE